MYILLITKREKQKYAPSILLKYLKFILIFLLNY